MTLRPPRRIFRAQPNSSRATGRVGETVMVGLVGALIGAALVMLSAPSTLFGHAKPIYGQISAVPATLAIVDGQTLWLNGSLVRLKGVDAPPRGRLCRKSDGTFFDCGAAAVAQLAELTHTRAITCQLDGADSAGFALGACTAGDVDLNRGMIASGWAHASSNNFRADEAGARDKHLGIWADPSSL